MQQQRNQGNQYSKKSDDCRIQRKEVLLEHNEITDLGKCTQELERKEKYIIKGNGIPEKNGKRQEENNRP